MRKINDFHITVNSVSLLPLDISGSETFDTWIAKYQSNLESWDQIIMDDIEKFIQPAGTGANGVVIKCKQKNLNRFCAVKFWLPNQSRRDPHYNLSFDQYLEEVQKISGLHDSRIVTVYKADVTKEGKHPFSIMEWFDGETLKDWLLKNSKCNMATKVYILNQIIDVMKKCHSIGVYHGDLHDKNIMIKEQINGDIELKILDFGTSLFVRDASRNQTKRRESEKILETALKLLRESKEFILLTQEKLKEDMYPPELLLESLDSLGIVTKLLNNRNLENEDILEIANAIAKSSCLNVDAIIFHAQGFLTQKQLEFMFNAISEALTIELNTLYEQHFNDSDDIVMLYILLKLTEDNNVKITNQLLNVVENDDLQVALKQLENCSFNLEQWIAFLLELYPVSFIPDFIEFTRLFVHENLKQYGIPDILILYHSISTLKLLLHEKQTFDSLLCYEAQLQEKARRSSVQDNLDTRRDQANIINFP
ncbi:protein kinase domain-containing protein [Gorillibacterium sp. sgz5001074]|uniref:protein kinase domain-containing protein n=1 Tax=Gorillibacterium sp. sgz5001074 TaxID=3446695 RepID=UPI003F671D00